MPSGVVPLKPALTVSSRMTLPSRPALSARSSVSVRRRPFRKSERVEVSERWAVMSEPRIENAEFLRHAGACDLRIEARGGDGEILREGHADGRFEREVEDAGTGDIFPGEGGACGVS